MPPDAASTGGRSGGQRTVPHPQGRSAAEDGQSRASCLARKAREPSRGRRLATPLRDRRTPPDPPRERSVQGGSPDAGGLAPCGCPSTIGPRHSDNRVHASCPCAIRPHRRDADASARRRSGRLRFRPRGLGDRGRHVPAGKRRADQGRGDRCPETHRDQAKCAGEIELGLRAKDRATSLLAGREVTFHRVGRSYNRTVATVTVDDRDLGTELVRLGAAAWWPRGRPKPIWCEPGRRRVTSRRR